MTAISPMMRQYQQAKEACPGAMLLFRMGDFYELFFDDAKDAARLINLTLTSRDKGENPTPMAGFPHHQLDAYLAKLIALGVRVAICEQVEDPRQAKGLVRRELSRVVTPGTLTDDALLDPRESNYLASVAMVREAVGLAWVELSTGVFQATVVPLDRAHDVLASVAPSEVLVAEGADLGLALQATKALVTRRPTWAFTESAALGALNEHFGTATLEGFGFDSSHLAGLMAAGAVIDYLRETQRSSLAHLDRLIPFRLGETLEIDDASRRSLELTRALRDGRREGALLGVLDRTVTAMGARRLADWLSNPLANRQAIEERLDAVADWVNDAAGLRDARERMRRVYDVERLLARVSTGRATPRDLSFLARTLAAIPELRSRLATYGSTLLTRLGQALDDCPEVREQLGEALEDDCPLTSREGGIIRAGHNVELDSLRELAAGGKQWMAAYQAEQAERTGIPNLKIGFNQVFGYYLEVTHAQRDKVPADFHRKQTIKNAERYVTPELKEYEEKILSADDKAKDLEHELFLKLRESVAAHASRLRATAAALSSMDVLAALADLAIERGYRRPRMVEEAVLEIVDGRHPVLDALLPAGAFVPNDVSVGGETANVLLITGPNMAGKSTYIRQTALLAIMAQIGSFVPARSATIGVSDRVFARVGASDELQRGQSTFMVEMVESARILNTASARSLVILDEIGRGTSTYDGVSLAWAMVEHLHDRVGCRTLFATHYHELTDLAKSLGRVRNLNVVVREWQDELVFLHKIVEGAADKSYGIHVARLAGVPREVVERAKQVLSLLEEEHLDVLGRPKLARRRGVIRRGDLQLSLFGPSDHPLLDEIRKLDADMLSHEEALSLIHKWQAALGEKPHASVPC